MKPNAERLFDTSLYTTDAIEEAIHAFSGLASFSKAALDAGIRITLTPHDHVSHAPDTLVAEFANFALAETIHRSR